MGNKDWKEFEKLVQLIERSISPESRILLDIELPIINGDPGETSQCDIVIISGKKPRETITIVEVQNRNEKVKANTFRGWEKKLDDVGAHHLIAVSRHDFTKSIKRKASKSNGKLMLVTLSEIDVEKIPINIHFDYRNFEVKSLENVIPSISRSEMIELGIRESILSKNKIGINEKCFSLNKMELISLHKLSSDKINNPTNQKSGESKIVISRGEKPTLYYFYEGNFLEIGIEYEITWTDELIDIPIGILSYNQNEYGVLAWVAQATYNSPKGEVGFKIPFMWDGKNFIIKEINYNFPPDTELTMTIIKNS